MNTDQHKETTPLPQDQKCSELQFGPDPDGRKKKIKPLWLAGGGDSKNWRADCVHNLSIQDHSSIPQESGDQPWRRRDFYPFAEPNNKFPGTSQGTRKKIPIRGMREIYPVIPPPNRNTLSCKRFPQFLNSPTKKALHRAPFGTNQFAAADSRIGMLFVSNLDDSMADLQVRSLFEPFGPLRDTAVHYTKHGQSFGTADVIFDKYEDAIQAKEALDGILHNERRLKVELVMREFY